MRIPGNQQPPGGCAEAKVDPLGAWRAKRTAVAVMLAALLAGGALLAGAGCSGDRDGLVFGRTSENGERPPRPAGRGGTVAERTLEELQASGVLRVATRNAPTTYYLDRHDRPVGPEYDLLQAFADDLGLTLELVLRETPAAVLDAVERGKADLAAAGLTETASRATRFAPGPSYDTITEQLVCRRDGPHADNLDELANVEIAVAAGSAYVETLQLLAETRPGVTFDERDRSSEQILAAVADGRVECAVADSHVVALNRRYHPNLKIYLNVTDEAALVWMYRPADTALGAALEAWFAKEGTLALAQRVREQYFAFVQMFDFVELRAFQRRIDDRYPQYDELFAEAAAKYEVPQTLLAAQAYQESQWNPAATSPTGVRGIMMLTRPTAEAMGVQDRLDPHQAIEGGARYLARMRERFSDEIPDPDRLYLALAAYNIGRAHMHDAQSLTRERGGNPYSWDDVKAVLPLLADRDVYPKLKYGYARGTEPVRYVERIRNYEDILRRSAEAR